MQAEAALAECASALWTVIKTPARQRPTAAEWLAGPFADRIAAIQDFALQKASPRDTALAIETLQVSAHLSETPSDAVSASEAGKHLLPATLVLLPRSSAVQWSKSSKPSA